MAQGERMGWVCMQEPKPSWLALSHTLVNTRNFTHYACFETRAQVGAAQGEVLLVEQRLV